jgi:hypothetical protein
MCKTAIKRKGNNIYIGYIYIFVLNGNAKVWCAELVKWKEVQTASLDGKRCHHKRNTMHLPQCAGHKGHHNKWKSLTPTTIHRISLYIYYCSKYQETIYEETSHGKFIVSEMKSAKCVNTKVAEFSGLFPDTKKLIKYSSISSISKMKKFDF